MIEKCEQQRRQQRTTEHGYTISSPCEPNGSGELINSIVLTDQNISPPSHKQKYVKIRAVAGQRSSPDLCFATTSVKIYDP